MRTIEIILLALVAKTYAEGNDKLISRGFNAETQHGADMDGTTLWKTAPTTHSAEEVNENGPTPNATLNKILQAKWAAKISAGPHTCSAEDQSKIMKFPSGHADDSWGKIITDCAHAGLNVFTGVNSDEFNSCLESKVKLTKKCSQCYATMAEYDFENCKVPCLFNWCSEGCISCNHGSDVIGCIGFVDPQPTICTTSVAEFVQARPTVISFAGVALMALFMGSGVIFSVLGLRKSASLGQKEPLMADHYVKLVK